MVTYKLYYINGCPGARAVRLYMAYKNIDVVIPVPLHSKKLKLRGYNQVAKFAEQIAESHGAA